MKKLEIEESKAVTAYKNGDQTVKKLLDDLFGDKTFKPVMERIKSFEDALAEVGGNANQNILLSYNGVDNEVLVPQAYYKLRIIAKALQEGWQPDWTNSNEAKWSVWFKYKSGVGFVVFVAYYVNAITGTFCGSRLCFPTSEMARYFGEQFLELHRIVLEN
ncbi:MAG TPA: hypothetical protein PK431_01550 [Chitinophagales bacterium]|nr:hypothetical protein [Chitinophagales bacterium]